ncbi:MAG: LysM peptidoglycan-binding domain-containing protein [Chloroflexota bacterium]
MKSLKLLLAATVMVVVAACSPQAQPTPTVEPSPTEEPATDTPAPTQTPIVITQVVTAQPTAAPASTGNQSLFATRTNCTVNAGWTVEYTVQAGDTVSRIAAAASSTVQAVSDGNCLGNANNIFVGQNLRLPQQPVFAPTEETPEATEEPTDAATEEMTEEPMATEEMTEEPMATEEMEEMTEEPMATEEPTSEATEESMPEMTEEPASDDVMTEEPASDDVMTEEPAGDDTTANGTEEAS